LLSEEESKDEEQFSMNYQLKYGGRETIWTENCATTLHKSQQIIIEYMLAHADQTIELQVTATSAHTERELRSHCSFEMHDVLGKTMLLNVPVKPVK
jgi:hypothetical protein